MKIKALTAAFVAAISLTACDQFNAPADASPAAVAPTPVFDVQCKDNQGRIMAEGTSSDGLTNWGGGQTRVVFTDGREYQQAGGVCMASKASR